MNFEEIRPYHDEEVPEKIRELLKAEEFRAIVQKVYPELPLGKFEARLLGIQDIKQFQKEIIVPILDKLIKYSSNGLDYRGIENIEKDKAYLFVSTHRDIVLDSTLMNYVLMQEGFETAEIAIGDNLMTIPWVVDLVKLNKSFIVKRDVKKEEKVKASIELSNYINYTIQQQKNSIWIAQRSGRSKDGDDRTNKSLIKMFNLAGTAETAIENLQALNICPITVSYEYNPCDILTIPELIKTAKGEKYEKAPLEDMQHMAKGIEGPKGRIMVSFGKPINDQLESLKTLKSRKDIFNGIVDIIDNQIHQNYYLMPTNYIAYDLLMGKSEFTDRYSEGEKVGFQTYMDVRLNEVEGDDTFLHHTFLKMYANPVINQLRVE